MKIPIQIPPIICILTSDGTPLRHKYSVYLQESIPFAKGFIVASIYVDQGNPYIDSPLKTGQLTLQETVEGSPLHTKAYFPLEAGEYPVLHFLGGLNGYVLTEFYSTVLEDIASHGFFVFGIDYQFPGYNEMFIKEPQPIKVDLGKIFKEIEWLEIYFKNRTISSPVFNLSGIFCHSAGCEQTVKMIKEKPNLFKSTIFLEPYSDEKDKMNLRIPALMYGTQLSEEGMVKCAIPGFDYNALYDIWSCPRVVMNVADFGHCDILDPIPWEGCHLTHFCKTTNDTRLPEYRKFVQGVISAFFISTLQGNQKDVGYFTSADLIPLKLLELKSDLNCTKATIET